MRKVCGNCYDFFETENIKQEFCLECREEIEITICKDCGKEFHISRNKRNYYLSNNLKLPKRCQSCVNKKKEKNKILDLSPYIGQKIKRISPHYTGDRSHLGHTFILKEIKGEDLIVELTKKWVFHEPGTIKTLEKYNDGYWKIV